jgi:hypothetical protein
MHATVTQSINTVEFDVALRTLATRAHSRYAGEGARIDRGLVLALNGHVTLCPDGTALVRSEHNAEVSYRVAHGLCDCPDGTRAPDGRCKHRYAVCLVRKAQPTPAPLPRWYATYLSDARAQQTGIAQYTPHGWTFTPDDGSVPPTVTLHDLCLLGHVATVDAQDVKDKAACATAWEIGMLWSGCQVMA